MKHQKAIDQKCIKMINNRMTYKEIKDFLHISSRRITALSRGETINHSRGRPSLLTEDMISFIEANSLADARLSDGEITGLLNSKYGTKISVKTVARKRKELGLIYRPPLTQQALSEEQKQSRIMFCE